jgi:hypothetical protein
LPGEFTDDEEVKEAAENLTNAIDSWVSDQDWEDPDERTRPRVPTSSDKPSLEAAERSIFDDLLDGRSESGNNEPAGQSRPAED